MIVCTLEKQNLIIEVLMWLCLLQEVKYLVIEMSSISYLDSSGCNLLTQLFKDYKAAGIVLCLAGPSGMSSVLLQFCFPFNHSLCESIFFLSLVCHYSDYCLCTVHFSTHKKPHFIVISIYQTGTVYCIMCKYFYYIDILPYFRKCSRHPRGLWSSERDPGREHLPLNTRCRHAPHFPSTLTLTP